MSKPYIGTTVVFAYPQTKDGRDGYAVEYEDGHTSWSPKETFERAYRPMTRGEKALIDKGGIE